MMKNPIAAVQHQSLFSPKRFLWERVGLYVKVCTRRWVWLQFDESSQRFLIWIRNEYGLADPELYKAVDRDDPEALLEGVAMFGLVAVLCQLGNLAEFLISFNVGEEVQLFLGNAGTAMRPLTA